MSCKKAINVVNVGAKTINIAKEKLTKNVPSGRPPGVGCMSPPIPPPPATHIRVCTPEQLRSMCPPHPCECPVVPKPLTPGEKATRAILLVVKVMLLLGVIKWTDELGLWGSTEDSKKTAEDAYKRLAPALGGDKKDNDKGQYYGLTYNIATMWNNTVGGLIYMIGVFPTVAFRRIFYGKRKKEEEEEAPAEAPVKANLKKAKAKSSRQTSLVAQDA